MKVDVGSAENNPKDIQKNRRRARVYGKACEKAPNEPTKKAINTICNCSLCTVPTLLVIVNQGTSSYWPIFWRLAFLHLAFSLLLFYLQMFGPQTFSLQTFSLSFFRWEPHIAFRYRS